MKNKPNRAKLGIYTFFSCIVAIILVVGINLLASALPENFRIIDTSASEILTLSDATKDYVKNLESKVSIYLVSEKNEIDATVQNVLNRYDALSKNLSVEIVDPISRPALIAKYTDKELENNSLIITCGARSKVIDAFSLFSFSIYGSTDGSNIDSYGNMSYNDFSLFYEENSTYFENYLTYGVGYTYEMLFDGEKVITSSIDYVVSDVFPTVYYTIGHGETELSQGLLTALEIDNVKCESLSIATKKAIPDDCALLVIASPVSDLSDEEATLVLDYLKRAGKLFLITSYNHADLKNISQITATFGMRAESSIINETDDNYIFSNDSSEILPITDNANKFLSLEKRYLITPKAHPIFRTTEADEGSLELKLSFTDLFVSSQTSVLAKEDNNENSSEKDDAQSFVVGMLARSDDSALLWISCSDFLDPSVNVSAAGGNYIYATALIENLCEKRSAFSIASKLMVEDSLVITSAQSGFWSVMITIIIPLTFVTIGVSIYQKRKSK